MTWKKFLRKCSKIINLTSTKLHQRSYGSSGNMQQVCCKPWLPTLNINVLILQEQQLSLVTCPITRGRFQCCCFRWKIVSLTKQEQNHPLIVKQTLTANIYLDKMDKINLAFKKDRLVCQLKLGKIYCKSFRNQPQCPTMEL